jgi:polar amino acid transport system substrate-binding protein
MKNKTTILIGLLTFILVSFSDVCFAQENQKEKLVFTLVEGQELLIKYANQVFKEVSKRTGIDCSTIALPNKRALIYANDGVYDGVGLRAKEIKKEYSNLKRIDVSIFAVQHVIFAKHLDIFDKVNDLKSLHDYARKTGYKVGYMLGSKKAEAELSKLPDALKHPLNSSTQGFKMLESGRIQLYLAGPGIVNRSVLKADFSTSGIKEVSVVAEFPLYSYVHLKHQHLIPKLEKTFRSMVEDGTLKKIRLSLE